MGDAVNNLVALLNRAADRLDALHHAALDAPWWMDGNEIMQMDRGSLQPEPSSIGRVAEEDGDLIVALRPVVAPLADWLRSAAADCLTEPTPHPEFVHQEALAIARSVLGEPR